MTRNLIASLIIGLGLGLSASAAVPAVIPAPASVSTTSGEWTLPAAPSVIVSGTGAEDTRRLLDAVKAFIPGAKAALGKSADISLTLAPANTAIPAEGYLLAVTPAGVTATASTPAGLFYAVQTLRSLAEESGGRSVAAVEISDSPRLPYRGMMLDVSRNFRSKEFIKKQLDAMARLKLNNLHFHLTDGAGWRLEIDRYPRLTEFAAWRPADTWTGWNEAGNKYVEQTDPMANGGFYTKDDIREILQYAADRYINVIPEIEMPSHSEEVLAAYPELSCTHREYGESDFCPGNEKTFEFLENVLTEVMELFPSELIHIGGDEAPKRAWRDCELCQKRMAEEGIEDVDGLQSYLIHRIERFLNDNGRSMLGWDEIMEGGLAPNATVMSWRGTAGGEKAAAAGHNVVMTPGRYCYLDGYQDAPPTQPLAIGGYLPLELAYSYEPVPESLAGTENEHYIFGLQGNLFTEYVPTDSHAEYMLYPRMYAIAERAWSPKERRDYPEFRRRAVALSKQMTADGYTVFDLENEVGNRPEVLAGTDRHLAFGKKVIYNHPAWSNYPANGEKTLVDGLHGGWNYNDARWQGFVGPGTQRMDVTIDLGEPTDLTSVTADFMQLCGPGVWMPAEVTVALSDDGETFRTVGRQTHKVEHTDNVSFINFGWHGNDRARYIRFVAEADPDAGGCLFTDEIVVR
ncbi:MAG: family 20 glycosylhydrolase [Clostridium sp.]|nr:family 20 glycosylhydrolase [Clostridium sp.]